MPDTITYLKNFVQDRYVASVTPTSRRVIRQLCERIDFEESSLLIEYGPGTGVISRELLAQMRPDAELVLIERNSNFASILRREFSDPRVTVYNEDAKNVKMVLERHGSGPADYVISGIPFSWLRISARD
jgi:phospholipid N-methyltransferase